MIHEYYGGTETGAAVYHNSEEALSKPGTVGRAVPGTVFKVFNEQGHECPPGEALCAHVDVDPERVPTEYQVRDLLRERIAGYKVPVRIVFDTKLPREDSGKIMKRKIRDRYWRGSSTQI